MKRKNGFFSELKDEFEWLRILLLFVVFVLSGWYLYWSFIVFYPQIKECDINAICLTLWGCMNLLCFFAFIFSLLMLGVLCLNIFKFCRKYIQTRKLII